MESRTVLQMNRLIRLLQLVDESPDTYMTGEDSKRQYDVTHPVIRDIIQYASDYLTVGIDVHFCREILKEAGYIIYPGEIDRFGWLTAYFQMKKGIILFG